MAEFKPEEIIETSATKPLLSDIDIDTEDELFSDSDSGDDVSGGESESDSD